MPVFVRIGGSGSIITSGYLKVFLRVSVPVILWSINKK